MICNELFRGIISWLQITLVQTWRRTQHNSMS